jgi:predicted nucleic acid-binding protein
VIVCDTGPLVAAALSNDEDHRACVDMFTGLHHASRPVLVPGPVIAEVGYLLEREAGPRVEAKFLRSLATWDLQALDLISDDFARMAELVDTYADLPLGTTDAAVIAVSERLMLTEIAALDRRHFSVVRPAHADAFMLLPD